MFTKDVLEEINRELASIPVKNKQYVQVTERIKGFRRLSPQGSIVTEIVDLVDGVVTMKATVYDDDGKVLGTGYAQEKETSSFINKTSFIENCETSAVGRALGFCGIGIDSSMSSAEEVANAITQQAAGNEIITEKEAAILSRLCERKGKPNSTYRGKALTELTVMEYTEAVKALGKLPDKDAQ